MITENLSTLKIHKLTKAQYERELAAGNIDANALYLTPDEETDLSGYVTTEQLTTYETKTDATTKLTEANSYTDTKVDDLSEGFNNVILQMYGGSIPEDGNITIRGIANDEAAIALDSAKEYTDTSISTHVHSQYLESAGGTMTGSLLLNSDPVEDLEAATKQYVDNAKNVWYGTCTGAGSSGVKNILTTTGDFRLEEGNVVFIKFNEAHTAGWMNLAIDSATETMAIYESTGSGASVGSGMVAANEIICFVYNGNYFVMVDGAMANTSQYGVTKLSSATDSTSQALAATPYAVKQAYDLATTANTAAADAVTTAQTYTDEQINAAKNTWYGTCPTAASTAAKVVTTNTGDFSLTTGNIVYVLFTYAATASTTLNIDGTGAITVKTVATTNVSTYQWAANEVVGFVYDGTYFRMLDGMVASTTYYGMTKLSSSTSSTATNLAATPSAVKSAYDLANAALPKSGGTMTGALTLNADPTSNLHAATKQYVDNLVGSILNGAS